MSGKMSVKSGFSLIELLVVVAIIGILAAVGITGYQVYIAQTRDATTVDNFEFLKRTLDQDILSLENDLSARSDFADNLSSTSQCFQLRDKYIADINLIRSNPFNEAKGQVCDGNHFASHQNELLGSTADNITLVRGQTMVYCDGIDVRNASWKRVNDNLGLKFCTCTGQETCQTQKRYFGTVLSTAPTPGSSGNTDVTVTGISNPSTARVTNGSQLLIGDQLVNMQFGTENYSGPNHVLEVSLPSPAAAGDTVYEVNGQVCFTPPGETTKALYLADFSDLEVSSTLPDRHTCY